MIELTNENLNDFISSGNVVIDAFATWCGPCKVLGPIFESVSKSNETVKFAKADVEECDSITSFGIRGVPCLLFFKDGKLVNKHAGLVNENDFQNLINSTF